MTDDPLDLERRVFVIAEIGANHEGRVEAAIRMIDAAARCGVDAVKFQTYRADTIVSPAQADRWRHFKRLELREEDFLALSAHAGRRGVVFLSTPFDAVSVDFLSPLVPAFKVASGDLTAHPLLTRIATKGKPILLSTGMATLEEIRDAVQVIERGHPAGASAPITLLHCVSAYPTPDDHANLCAIPHLREHLGRTVGYSDHTLGIEACLAAVALGARVIEKHFTLDKTRTTLRDHQLSADPADMAALVSGVRRIETMRGDGAKGTLSCETENRVSMRRSLAAAVDIAEGQTIARDMLTVLRPGTGLAPSELEAVVGLRAARSIHAGELLTADAVEGMRICSA